MNIMKTSIVALFISAACVGCETKPAAPVNTNKPLEVTAPGVDVKVDPQRGVDVKAPGVDVETK
jgi:hypothetical protein